MKYLLISFSIFTLLSCNNPSKLSKEFNCNSESFKNLKKHTDYKKQFSIKFPKSWKTNYYYDNLTSSIYSADTTISLTKTTLIDISFIQSEVNFNEDFKKKLQTDNLDMNLVEISSKPIDFLNKKSFLNLAKGKKGKFDYQILNVFTKIDEANFLHLKTEVYGNSLVNERICKAIKLLERIKIN